MFERLMQILFKQKCLLCQQSSNDIICDFCFDILHKQIITKPSVVDLDGEYDYYQILEYSRDTKYLLAKLKFNKDPMVIKIFHKLIDAWVDNVFSNSELNTADYITVTPIHRFRYLYRGFNQSELLVQGLVDATDLQTVYDYTIRAKYTKSQAKSHKLERQSQIKGVFKQIKPIQAKHLIIFDDVFTTGSTIKEFISEISKDSKIDKISVVTLIRAGDLH